jgi:hypothetical protein
MLEVTSPLKTRVRIKSFFLFVFNLWCCCIYCSWKGHCQPYNVIQVSHNADLMMVYDYTARCNWWEELHCLRQVLSQPKADRKRFWYRASSSSLDSWYSKKTHWSLRILDVLVTQDMVIVNNRERRHHASKRLVYIQ